MKISDVDLGFNTSFDMILFTKEEFKMHYGVDLEVALEDDDDIGNKEARFINNVGHKIKDIVRDYSFKDLSLYNEELYYNGRVINNMDVIMKVKQAAMEQCSYMLINGDLGSRSGIGINRKMFSNRDKKRVMYSRNAINLLMEAGLLGGVL